LIQLTTGIVLLINTHFRIIITVFNAQFYAEGCLCHTKKYLFQYFVKSKWQVWICFHFICMLFYYVFVYLTCVRCLICIYWNIENSNQLPQQLKHMRIKFYIYVIPEYRVPWLDVYKYPLPDTCTRSISCTLERPFNDVMYSLFNGMYLSLSKLNFRCAFMFSNPFLRDSLVCVIPKSTSFSIS
jgi:hypothetical protein